MPPIGTPGLWLAAGDTAAWSADCIAALIACGINPDVAGPYGRVSSRISRLRDRYRDRRIADAAQSPGRDHEPGCARNPRKTSGTCSCYESANPQVANDLSQLAPGSSPSEAWLVANSEAGHICADNIMRSGTPRGSPCANAVPGYREDESFTILHHGDASGWGMHRAVREREYEHEAYLRARYPDGRIPPDEIRRGIANNAQMSVNYTADGSRNPGEGGARAIQAVQGQQPGLAQAADQHRDQLRQEMQAKVAGDPGLAAKVNANTVNGPNGVQPTEAAREKAAKCLEEKALQSIAQNQKDTVDENSTVANSAACQAAIAKENAARAKRGLPPVTKFSELPQWRRKEVLRQTQGDVAARNQQIQNPPQPDTRTQAQRDADCLELQGNGLAGSMRKDGTFPPMAGGTPRGNAGSTRARQTDGRVQPPKS